jgi:hypothetical protein
LDSAFQFFAGIDWGSDKHRVCLISRDGQILAERWIEHSGDSLAELAAWLSPASIRLTTARLKSPLKVRFSTWDIAPLSIRLSSNYRVSLQGFTPRDVP